MKRSRLVFRVLILGTLFTSLLFLSPNGWAQQSQYAVLINESHRLANTGDYKQAIVVGQKALSVAEANFGPVHPTVGLACFNLAGFYLSDRQFEKAELMAKRSEALAGVSLDPSALPSCLLVLGQIYAAQDNFVLAEPYYNQALTKAEKVFGRENPKLEHVLMALGELKFKQREYQSAERIYKRTLTILEKAKGPNDQGVGFALVMLAYVYRAQGKTQLYDQCYKRGVEIITKTP
jgi:tetratricopeptide (TPR) repeat protein